MKVIIESNSSQTISAFGRMSVFDSRDAFGSGGAFTPPAPPPIDSYAGWWASRQVILSPPGNPDDLAIVDLWDDLNATANNLSSKNPGDNNSYLKTGGPNSLPVVISITSAGYATVASVGSDIGFSGANPWSLVYVASSDAGGALFGIGSNSLFNRGLIIQQNAIYASDGTTQLLSWTSDGSFHIRIVTYDGTSLTVLEDGVAVATAIVVLNLTNAPLQLGGSTFGVAGSTILSFEVVPYNFLLTSGQIQTSGRWYAGVGTGSPQTGLVWP